VIAYLLIPKGSFLYLVAGKDIKRIPLKSSILDFNVRLLNIVNLGTSNFIQSWKCDINSFTLDKLFYVNELNASNGKMK
jgi:hypothetical protein